MHQGLGVRQLQEALAPLQEKETRQASIIAIAKRSHVDEERALLFLILRGSIHIEGRIVPVMRNFILKMKQLSPVSFNLFFERTESSDTSGDAGAMDMINWGKRDKFRRACVFLNQPESYQLKVNEQLVMHIYQSLLTNRTHRHIVRVTQKAHT